MKKVAVGTPVWLHLASGQANIKGGVDAPLHAIVAGVEPVNGLLSLTVSSGDGSVFARQGVELLDGKAQPSGDYATMPGTDRLKQKAEPAGDASASPNNTAAGNMSDSAKSESASPGQPTTGGVTPKISADNAEGIAGQMTELEREQAANGTGSNAVKAMQKAVDDGRAQASAKATQDAKDTADRLEKQEAASKKPKSEQAMPNRGAAKKAPAKKAAAKTPAKKVAAKKKR